MVSVSEAAEPDRPVLLPLFGFGSHRSVQCAVVLRQSCKQNRYCPGKSVVRRVIRSCPYAQSACAASHSIATLSRWRSFHTCHFVFKLPLGVWTKKAPTKSYPLFNPMVRRLYKPQRYLTYLKT